MFFLISQGMVGSSLGIGLVFHVFVCTVSQNDYLLESHFVM